MQSLVVTSHRFADGIVANELIISRCSVVTIEREKTNLTVLAIKVGVFILYVQYVLDGTTGLLCPSG